jgi:hypothetical protein
MALSFGAIPSSGLGEFVAVPQSHGLDLIKLLQEALRRVEEAEKLEAGDPALLRLKQRIVRTIADLKVAQDARSSSA